MSLVTFLGIYFVRVAGIDLRIVGLAFLAENLLRGLAAPFFGALSDRIGRRPLLIASALSTAVVLPSFLLVEGPASLFLWSVALGTTGAINMPVAGALLIDLSPPDRRQSTLAANYTAMSVAYTLGVAPAGFVAQQGYGLLAALSACGYVLVAVLYAFALRREDRPSRALEGKRSVLADTASVARDPLFLRFASVAFVFPLSMGLVVTVSPIFGADLGLGEGYIGLVLGGNSIIVALLAMPVAARMEAAGPFRWLGVAAAIVSVSLILYAVIPDPAAALMAGTVMFSFAELVFSSAIPAAVARLAPPERRGAYQGGWTLVASLAMGSALMASGVVRDLAGWQGAWLAFAGLVALCGVALYFRREGFLEASRRRQQP